VGVAPLGSERALADSYVRFKGCFVRESPTIKDRKPLTTEAGKTLPLDLAPATSKSPAGIYIPAAGGMIASMRT
jgi:hypothetical protein